MKSTVQLGESMLNMWNLEKTFPVICKYMIYHLNSRERFLYEEFKIWNDFKLVFLTFSIKEDLLQRVRYIFVF
jgi:hypothetical protein